MAPVRPALVASLLAGTALGLVAACTSGTTPDCSDAQCGPTVTSPEAMVPEDAGADGLIASDASEGGGG
jgi:hypothetical protein